MPLSPFHALFTARTLSDYASGRDRLVPAYASSDIEVYPYQIAAAMFALRSPYIKGVVLADEGGLGKTYEALLVITQLWFEGKERILLVVPTPLLHQWWRILQDCFSVPFQIHAKDESSFDFQGIILTTYGYATENVDKIDAIAWDVAVFEEAHRLANRESKTTTALKKAVGNAFKLLLTATPMRNSIMDLYGLIDFIDTGVLGDADEFYKRYFRKLENYFELTATASRYCFRTLRVQMGRYAKIPHRIPMTVDYSLSPKEAKLGALVDAYLKKPDKLAFPKMDSYDLTLLFNRALSSSPFALSKLADTAVGRVRELELVEIEKLATDIQPKTTGKGEALLKALKVAFVELKKHGANRKAIIFTESIATLGFLQLLLSDTYKTIAFDGSKSSDYSILKKFETEAEILITTDVAAEGFDFSFCSFLVNYDLPYNVLTLEQRIMRCHRLGQQSDVVVLNFLNRNNFADVRMLELINKRVAQFDGIMGMSDDVVGNFVESADEGIAAAFALCRSCEEIEKAHKAMLAAHETQNTAAVNEAENALFTTFTRNIAEKVAITPQYIKDRTEEINAKLWELTKWFFEGKQGYACVEEGRTVRIGIQPQKVFTGAHLGRREYSIDDKDIAKSGRHTVSGTLAKNMISEVYWQGIPDVGTVIVSSEQLVVSSCKIGYYRIKVTSNDNYWSGVYYSVFVGKTQDGRLLSDSECREIMALPIISFSTSGSTYGERDGNSRPKPQGELDTLIDVGPFMHRATADTDDIRRDEIKAIENRAYYQKQALGRDIEVMKGEVRQTEKRASGDVSITDIVILEKKKATASREIKAREQSLFLESCRIDTEAEAAIQALTDSANLSAEVKRYFVIKVEGNCT